MAATSFTTSPRSHLVEASLTLPFEFYSIGQLAGPRHIYLLLHGFQQSGRSILKRLQSAIDIDPAQDLVLAPNAPFPLPRKTQNDPGARADEGYKLGYTWYFYERRTDAYLIDMKPATGFLVHWLAQNGWESRAITVIGYSQGGYLAPFVASELPACAQVIGISCEFLPDEIPRTAPAWRLDSIHGDADAIVDPIASARSHARLVAEGFAGERVTVPGSGHEVDAAIGAALRSLLGRTGR